MIKTLMITNARLVSGKDEPRDTLVSIRIHAGRIEEIGQNLVAGGEAVLDAGGGSVLPGFIDPHVHLQSVPGAAFRGDEAESRLRACHRHLRAYLACGVTTVLDAAISAPELREIRRYLDSGGIGPRVLALGPALYPPGGYLDNDYLTEAWGPMWSPVATADDVHALFDEYDGIADIVGAKVVIEFGFSPFYDWPIHTPEMRAHIVEAAASRKLPLYVHSIQHRAHLVAMEMEPRALVHSGFVDRGPSPELIERMRASGTYMMTTLSSLYDCWLVRRDFLKGIDDPLIHLTVPSEQIETAQDRRAWQYMWRHIFRVIKPRWLPSGVADLGSRLPIHSAAENSLKRRFRAACRGIVTLHDGGIPIVMGTDSGAWPLIPSCFHGYSTIREMELLADAGLDPLTIIEAATRIPAEMLGLQDEIGTVEVGKRADLVVLEGDPLADIRALRSIRWTIREGEARSPDGWMDGS